jgi:hypothetical protein
MIIPAIEIRATMSSLPPPVAATSALLLELVPNTSVCDF